MGEPRLGSHDALEGPDGLYARMEAAADATHAEAEEDEPFHVTFLKHAFPGGDNDIYTTDISVTGGVVELPPADPEVAEEMQTAVEQKPRARWGYVKPQRTAVISAHTFDCDRIIYLPAEPIVYKLTLKERLTENYLAAGRGMLQIIGINL